jgi:type IV secretion system protein VirB11
VSGYAERLAEAEEIARFNFLAALGPLRHYLDDPFVYNVNANEDGAIFVEHAQLGKFEALETMPIADREALIGHLANREQRAIDRLHSRLQCDMPYYDVRCQAFCPPVANWTLIARKHAVRIFSLDDYVNAEQMTPAQRDALVAAIARRDNIFVVGAQNSGKTTFLNAVLLEAARVRPHARLVVIQDRRELKPSHRDVVFIMTLKEQAHHESNGTITRYDYSWLTALEDMLRTTADMYAWGEVREVQSAVGLVMAANTGAEGIMATLHCNSIEEAPERLEDMLLAAHALPARRRIARLMQTIVLLKVDDDGRRRVDGVRRIDGADEADRYVWGAAAA